ncbi:MAG TPA: hypothetical protein VKZ87_09640 [Ferrovibrio sp.]|jgi:hypothetical protein|uniref:hypothetical protein n=1 Tax=Ferrovibrio sp. TaxID=1917215 RepID=UPI002B4B7FAE|nr:hypothetical protein [Ferrovibrio sp.]HLT77638.1 hypothetical protein [Ferrovibrio sp.]
MSYRRALPAVAILFAAGLGLGACQDKQTAPDQRHTGLSSFVQFIQKTGSLKSLNTYYRQRPQIQAEERIGVIYDGARTEGEVMRFKDKVTTKEMLPALQAVRKRLGETENCVARGYFIACGDEKFVEIFRKWE